MGDNSKSARRWLEHGASLIATAQFLFEQLHPSRAISDGPLRVLRLGQLRGALTLLGAGLECTLKARAVADGIIKSAAGRGTSKLSRLWSSHNLRAMAESLGLALEPSELLLLDRASHGVRWIGRYPDPKTRAELEEAVGIDAQKLKSADFLSAKRIHAIIQATVRA